MESSSSKGRTKSMARKKVASNVQIPFTLSEDIPPSPPREQQPSRAPTQKRTTKPSLKRKESEKAQPSKKKKAKQVEKPQEGVSKWFSTKAQEEAFYESFATKPVAPIKFLNFEELSTTRLEVFELLKFQGLETFITLSIGNIIPDLIRVFYSNLSMHKNVLKSQVKTVSIKITSTLFFNLFGLKNEGPDVDSQDYVPEDYNKFDFYKSMCRENYVQKERVREVLNVGPLTPSDRLLHYFITYVLVPRNTNHATLTDHDLYLMFLIKNKIKLKWYTLIINHMINKKNTSSLPYAFQIMHLLNSFNIDFTNETQVQLSKRVCCISIQSLAKLDIVLDATDHRYKYSSELGKASKKKKKEKQKQATTSTLDEDVKDIMLKKLDEIVTRIKRIEDHLGLPPLIIEDHHQAASSDEDEDEEHQQEEEPENVEQVEDSEEEHEEPLAKKLPKQSLPQQEVQVDKVISGVLTQLQHQIPRTSREDTPSSSTSPSI